MSNPYVWLDITADGKSCGTSSSIVFTGKEQDCINWVRKATYEKNVYPTIRYQLKSGFWFRFGTGILLCRLMAGEGPTKVEKKFRVHII